MHPVTYEQAREIAEQMLPATDDARLHGSYQMNAEAWQFVKPGSDGGTVLVDPADGSYLYATQAIAADEHIRDYVGGIRTDPAQPRDAA